MTTNRADYQAQPPDRGAVSVEELARRQGVRPVESVEDMARPGIFESDEELEDWLSGVVKLDSDPVISQEWGRISADARRRGRPRPANDTWVAACCLVHGLPLASLNLKDFEDFAEHEGLVLLSQ